jgi:hypothetical protein
MATAQIILHEGSLADGYTNPGSRDDLTLGVTIVCANVNDVGVTSWQWTLVDKPSNSTASLATPTANTTTFIPDIVGTYLIRLVVTPGNAQDQKGAAVKTANYHYRIPAAKETLEFDSNRGWATATNLALQFIDNGFTAPLANSFQQVYNISNPSSLTVNGTNGGLQIHDALTPVGNIFEVDAFANGTKYLIVSGSSVSVNNVLGQVGGQVGLGILVPTPSYAIAGDVQVHILKAGHDLTLIETQTPNSDAGIALFASVPNTNIAMFIDGSDAEKFKIATGTINTHANRQSNTKLTILQNGSIGIGTTAPTSLLHVIGTGHFTNVVNMDSGFTASANSTVTGTISVHGYVIDPGATIPSSGQALVYNGTAFTPSSVTSLPTVTSISALRASNFHLTNTAVILQGYYTFADGGGGELYWSSSSSATDDGGMVIKPTSVSGAGRWLRANAGIVNVLWYGAKNDGSNDLGAIINLADTFLAGGDGYGTIIVPDGPTYKIATQVSLSPNRTLLLGSGLYTTTISDTLFLYDSYCSIIGKGFNTVIQEPNTWTVISGKAQHANNNIDGESGIIIQNLQIKGHASSFNSAPAAISIGNNHGVTVDTIYFNATKSIGLSIGASSANGYFATDVTIKNCLFQNIASQGIGAVNANGFNIVGNILVAGGQSTGPGATYIDLEPNLTTDRLQNFNIVNNIIDARGSANPGNGINVQSVGGSFYGPGTISDNTITGGEVIGIETAALSNAIFISMRDILISGNTIKKTGQNGIVLISADHCMVQGNCLNCVGGGGISAITLDAYASHNQVLNNTIMYEYVVSSSNAILETAGCNYNTIMGNFIANTLDNDGNIDTMGFIVLAGANSSALMNNMNGRLTNQGGLWGCVSTITNNYTVGVHDQTLFVDTTSGVITITLPFAREGSTNNVPTPSRELVIRRIAGSNNITVTPQSGEKINGSASSLIISDGTANRIKSDTANWWTSFVGESINATEFALSTTSATNVINITSPQQSNWMVSCYYRVVGGTSNVTIVATWADTTGAQTLTLVNVSNQAIGSYSLPPAFINVASSATNLKITATAGTANRVFVSANARTL